MRLNYLSPEAQTKGDRQPRGVKRKRNSEHWPGVVIYAAICHRRFQRGSNVISNMPGGFVRPLSRAHYTLRLMVLSPSGLSFSTTLRSKVI